MLKYNWASSIRWQAVCLWAALLGFAPASVFSADYRHFGWQEVTEGVWFGTTLPDSFQGGNVVIVSLPGGGSLVVDSHNSDFLGREIIEKAKEVGRGPVRYLVNTHIHQDHIGGNAAFRKEFPRVEIIAHRNTCLVTPQKTIPRMKERLGPLQKQLAQMREQRAKLAAGEKEAASLDRRITGTELYLEDAKNFQWEMPNTCLDLKAGQTRVITDGSRRIEIGYYGRAHTTGDLVVFLPREKVVVEGDLWSANTASILGTGIDGRDGSVLEGLVALKGIRKLDFDVTLFGHGNVMRGKESLDAAIANVEKMVALVRESADRGDMVEETLQKIPPPPNTSPVNTDRWRRVVIRTFEEIELRRQLGMNLPE